MSKKTIYLALEGHGREPELDFVSGPCMRARVRTNQALLTLVGDSLKKFDVAVSLAHVSARWPVLMLPQNSGSCSVSLVVPQADLGFRIEALQQTFFRTVDFAFFASAGTSEEAKVDMSHTPIIPRREPEFVLGHLRQAPVRAI